MPVGFAGLDACRLRSVGEFTISSRSGSKTYACCIACFRFGGTLARTSAEIHLVGEFSISSRLGFRNPIQNVHMLMCVSVSVDRRKLICDGVSDLLQIFIQTGVHIFAMLLKGWVRPERRGFLSGSAHLTLYNGRVNMCFSPNIANRKHRGASEL